MKSDISVQPEFYDANEARQKYLSDDGRKYLERTKNRVTNPLKVEEYLLLWHERLKAEADRMRKICEQSVTVHRRFRGTTISDSFGYFGTRPETTGRWIDYDPDLDGEVHPINIVRPDIRVNNSALLQVQPNAQVKATNNSAKRQQKAAKIQRMVDYFGRSWTEADRLLIFDGIQKEGTWLVETYRCEGKKHKVQTPQLNRTYFAVYQCSSCGAQGKKEVPEELGASYQDKASPVPCPSCGAEASGEVKAVNNVSLTESEIQSYQIKHRLWSGFNYLIDRKRAAKGGIRNARFLRIHEIATRADLEADYPQHKFDHPFEFCYALKCEASLADNDFSKLNVGYSPALNSTEFDEFEKDTICLHKEAYKNYIAPDDYRFVDGFGKVKFEIKRGESMDEAVQRSFGEGTEGFRFVIVNDKLTDIVNDKYTEPDFRKAFTDVHFLRDSSSFHSVPNWDIVILQDDITLFNTLKTESTARNAIEPVFFNSEVFDIEDFGQDYIPSKDGILAEAVDIQRAVYKVPHASSAVEVNEHLQFLLGIRQEVSSVTPALRGEAQPGEPAYAQRQQLEQSQGILAPAAKSYAQMYIDNMRQKVEAAFDCWTFEQFQEVASIEGEKWTEEDIAELVATDLDTEVSFEYVPGTEQPQSNLVKEMKFFNGLREVTPFLQSGAITPDVMTQLLKKIDEYAGFEFDLSGLETSDALAQNRFEKMQNACRDYEGISRFRVEQMKSNVIAYSQETDPSGAIVQIPISEFEIMMEKVMQKSDILVTDFENTGAQALWFIERMIGELTKTKPNYVLIEAVQSFVKGLKAQSEQQKQEAIDKDPAVQAERAAAEQNAAAQEQQRAAAEEAKKADAETATEQVLVQKMLEEGAKEKERDFEREKMAFEGQQRELDRQSQSQS